MKYAIVKCTDGNYAIHAEGYADISAAKVEYHRYISALWNDKDTNKAVVMIADEQLNCVNGNREYISHTPEATNEPE